MVALEEPVARGGDSLGPVIGGALGNILDRVRQGAVTAFLDADYGGWYWPIFNMAEVGIVGGVGILLLLTLATDRVRAGR